MLTTSAMITILLGCLLTMASILYYYQTKRLKKIIQWVQLQLFFAIRQQQKLSKKLVHLQDNLTMFRKIAKAFSRK